MSSGRSSRTTILTSWDCPNPKESTISILPWKKKTGRTLTLQSPSQHVYTFPRRWSFKREWSTIFLWCLVRWEVFTTSLLFSSFSSSASFLSISWWPNLSRNSSEEFPPSVKIRWKRCLVNPRVPLSLFCSPHASYLHRHALKENAQEIRKCKTGHSMKELPE